MTPEFALNRSPDDALKNSEGYQHLIKDFYLWCQTQGYSAIINNYKDLIYQNSYSLIYEESVIRNMGIDISIVEGSPIRGELLLKLIDDFLETRGTKTSFDILFRIMFNKGVEIQYPRELLLNLSGFRYLRTKVIVISGTNQITLNSGIRGLRSNTQTGIESIHPYYIAGARYYIVHCNNVNDKLVLNEPLEITNIDFDAIYNEQCLPLIGLKIINPGKYYKKGDRIIPDNNLFEGHFVVSKVSKGGITSITINEGGIDYTVGDRIIIPGTHFSASITEVDENTGAVTSVKINNQGYNFTDIPNYIVKSENGSGLELTLDSENIGNVIAVDICEAGIVHYPNSINYTVESSAGTGLLVESEIIDSYYDAEYKNNTRDIQPKMVTVDSYTKHSHSYDIISEVPGVKYKSTLDKYLNPYGLVYNMIFSKINKINIETVEITGEITRT